MSAAHSAVGYSCKSVTQNTREVIKNYLGWVVKSKKGVTLSEEKMWKKVIDKNDQKKLDSKLPAILLRLSDNALIDCYKHLSKSRNVEIPPGASIHY